MEASTVGQLILRMREQAWRIQARTHGAEGHEQLSSQGWAKLAGTAGRVLQLLDADDRCLATLAALQQEPEDEHGRAYHGQLVPLATTIGALGDVLTTNKDILRRAPLAECARLRLNIQATLHMVADGSIRYAPAPDLILDHLLQLVQTTEAAALIPPAQRASVLDRLTLAALNIGGVGGAIARWASIAEPQLASHTQVTGYTFQATAAMIGMLCSKTAEASRFLRRRDPADRTPEALMAAFKAWRDAASWPAHVRLGDTRGYGELRRATGVLMATLAGPATGSLHPVERVLVLQDGLHTADRVAHRHLEALSTLAQEKRLWVAAPTLSPRWLASHPEITPRGWVTDPDGHAGMHLAATTLAATQSLRDALSTLDHGVLATTAAAIDCPQPCISETQPQWEVVTYSPTAQEEPRQSGRAAGGPPIRL